MAAAKGISVDMASGGDGVVRRVKGVVEVCSEGRGGGESEVESEVKTNAVEGGRRVEGECSEGCGVALKTILESIEDLKRYFDSEVNDLKSVVRKQEIEIRSLKCGGGGPSGVSGGAHARDVPGGVPEGDVPRATTNAVVLSKSPGIGEWKVVDHGARPQEIKVNNDHVVCRTHFRYSRGCKRKIRR
ncbi:hypothetical protein GWK47_025954 [Chionoecetes opilio]|uniref:Uncharacterized protein n=1 Tax=Chionoecetes opilio TaxID=41210 RepID=A0A8J8WMZ8_CHIOP|nr:hypothetical protein GWK47_025954 [Chionoecetes opilio]